MKRCPACRVRIKELCGAYCERCGCDLSMLLRIETQASDLLQKALSDILNNQLSQARKTLLLLGELKHSALGVALLNFVDRVNFGCISQK